MKYTPKELSENVNISKTSALREFAVLVGGILGVLLGLYILLGLAIDVVVPRISPEMEMRLASLYSSVYQEAEADTPRGVELQRILAQLVAAGSLQDHTYQVHLVDNPAVNALALPGGHIVIFSGLLDEVQSENELAMVLGHELGHFENRDHLRGLGRGMVLMALSAVTLGIDSSVSRILQSMLKNTEMRFSQQQERRADVSGLKLLVQVYGHAGGAVDFFARLQEQEKFGRLVYFFATHPYPEDRIAAMENLIREQQYSVLPSQMLSPVLQEVSTSSPP